MMITHAVVLLPLLRMEIGEERTQLASSAACPLATSYQP